MNLVDKLGHSNDLFLGIHNGHAEDGLGAVYFVLSPNLIVFPDPLVDIADVDCLPGGGHKLSNLGQSRGAQFSDRWPRNIGSVIFATKFEEHSETIAHFLFDQSKGVSKNKYENQWA